jgi:hypothetical protein
VRNSPNANSRLRNKRPITSVLIPLSQSTASEQIGRKCGRITSTFGISFRIQPEQAETGK